jgi:hypothetical protein
MILDSPIISGSSTVTGNLTVLGTLTASVSGSVTSASYATNAETLDGLDSTSFTSTSSFNTASGSFSTRITSNEGSITSLTQNVASLFATSASLNSRVNNLDSYTSSLNSKTGSFATTGSNNFNGNQVITGSLTTTGTITAQTLNVQQVTSSIVYSSGSNIFGNSVSNTQQFTGSLQVSGSNHYVLGNVNIGTTNTYYSNNLIISAGSEGGITIANPGTTGAQYLMFADGTSGNDRFRGYLTYNHTDNSLGLATDAVIRLAINSSGNLGLGVTPSAWGSNVTAFELPQAVSLYSWNASAVPQLYLGANHYWDGSNWRYKITGQLSTLYYQAVGQHIWFNASSGTAGNVISFTQAMTLNASGNLSIGNTNDTFKLDVSGTGYFSGQVNAATYLTLSEDGTYTGTYYTLGFSGKSNGANRIFAARDGSDGIYFAAATNRGFEFRPNGSTTGTFFISPTGIVTIAGPSSTPVALIITTGNSNCDITLQSTNSSSVSRIRNGTNDLQFHTNGTLALTLASNQAATFSSTVAVTTTGTTAALQVNLPADGNATILSSFGSNSAFGWYLRQDEVTTGDWRIFRRQVNVDYQVLNLSRGSGAATFASSVAATTGVFSISAGNPLQVYQTSATNSTTATIRQTGAGGNGNQDIGLIVDIQGANDVDRIANFRYYDGSTYASRFLVQRNGFVGIQSEGYSVSNTLSLGRVFGFVQDINSGYIQANMANSGNYIVSQYAVRMHLDSALGEITFLNAPSGTAGNAVSLTSVLKITASGNVGIGTTSPSQKLEVVGGEIKAGRVDSSSEGGQVSFARASDNATGWYIDAYGSTSSPSLRFVNVSDSSVVMSVTGSTVLVGTTTNSTLLGSYTKLKVSGDGSANAGASFGSAFLAAGSSGYDTGISVNMGTSGATMLLLASINTSVGTSTNAAVYIIRFYFSGNNAPTTSYIGGSSDFVTFSVSGTNTLILTGSSSGNKSYSWWINKVDS